MKLIHYTHSPLSAIEPSEPPAQPDPKPNGLWLSDDDSTDTWHDFYERSASPSPDDAIYVIPLGKKAYEISLHEGAKVLFIKTLEELRTFTAQYGRQDKDRSSGDLKIPFVDWKTVAEQYDGIVISPYQHEARMQDEFKWYYPWDTASGCIWNPRCVASVTPVPKDPVAWKVGTTTSEGVDENTSNEPFKIRPVARSAPPRLQFVRVS